MLIDLVASQLFHITDKGYLVKTVKQGEPLASSCLERLSVVTTVLIAEVIVKGRVDLDSVVT